MRTSSQGQLLNKKELIYVTGIKTVDKLSNLSFPAYSEIFLFNRSRGYMAMPSLPLR